MNKIDSKNYFHRYAKMEICAENEEISMIFFMKKSVS